MLIVGPGEPPKEEVISWARKPRMICVKLSEYDYQRFIQLADRAGMKPAQLAEFALLELVESSWCPFARVVTDATEMIGFRLTEDDYQMFAWLADRAGMKPSVAARIAILDLIDRYRI